MRITTTGTTIPIAILALVDSPELVLPVPDPSGDDGLLPASDVTLDTVVPVIVSLGRMRLAPGASVNWASLKAAQAIRICVPSVDTLQSEL